MRPIGNLQDETLARRFGDYLYSRGIENQVDLAAEGSWEVWVLDDGQLDTARSLLDRFRDNPDAADFVQASHEAARQRRQDLRDRIPKRNRVIDVRTTLWTPAITRAPLTLTLIGISIVVTILTAFGRNEQFVQPLSITEYQHAGQYIQWSPGLPEIRHGQIWRLFTPIFIHFGILHILFNMLWLQDLGGMIEVYRSRWLLLALVLVLAAISNLAQFYWSGPAFGGMSGVDFGLLGYIWMQSRFNPASRLALHPQIVTTALIWYFLCLFGIIPYVANAAHTGGLVVGVAWGFAEARLPFLRRRL